MPTLVDPEGRIFDLADDRDKLLRFVLAEKIIAKANNSYSNFEELLDVEEQEVTATMAAALQTKVAGTG